MNADGRPTPEKLAQDLGSAADRRPIVVGIGASAGGLEALEKLFAQMPPQSGMAFVVIQHLSPDFKSLTDTLLARRTDIPIRQAGDHMLVEPNVCYLLPPKKDMILADGHLLLSDKDPTQALALPIDRFFRSLAQDAGDRAVAVILSGTGSDGSRGIRDVRRAGGLVVVQDPETAKFDGMPKSALATGVVDLSLPPEEIPAALLRHLARLDTHEPRPALPDETPPAGMDAVIRLLRDAYGIDFAAYKSETVTRRIGRRLDIHRLSGVEEYAARLATDGAELNQLYQDLLIGVTRFFRDAEAFERLGHDVLPTLLGSLGSEDEFRVWVAGCATGEEAYSVAILIQECLDALPRRLPVKIFATDVHRASLDAAGAGFYAGSSLQGVSSQRLARFFVPVGEGYQITPELRKQVVFAQHNVLKDAPFTKLDLVVCRNLLIYFLPAAQKKALSLFHFGLKTGGTLFLGPSEGTGELSDEFEAVNSRWKLYRKRREVRLPGDVDLSVPSTCGLTPARGQLAARSRLASENSTTAILEMLLEESLAPSILVNERRQLVRTYAGGSQYVAARDGWFTNDVLEAVHPELRPVLAGALPRVFQESVAVTFKGLALRLADGEQVVDVRVKPLRPRGSTDRFALIALATTDGPRGVEPAREIDLGEAAREHLLAVETDLRSTRETLQATIEELETSNEELQATNEELTAANEELQSTNEELHSVNEELYTVNGEYQKKIEELTELSADMENLLASTGVHTIFLDRDFCVRKFTPKVADTFHLLPQDIGRRIDHFSHSIDCPQLLDDLQAVLATGCPTERQVRDRRGGWFLLRVHPYRAGSTVAGVVLTMVDIDQLKRAEAEARTKDEQLAGILRNSPNWVFVKDVQGVYLLADDAFKRIVGCDPVGKTAHDLFPREFADALVAQDKEVLRTEAAVEREVLIPQADGLHTYLSIMFPIQDAAGKITGLGGIRTDVTALKKAEAEARERVVQRDRFLALLSHELRNPLAAIMHSLGVIARVGPQSPAAAEWFSVVERRSRHMSRLLDDLLDVARVSQGKIEIRRETINLALTVPGVLEEVGPVLDDRGLTLHVDTPSNPVVVFGDPARLQQVQVNLLMNAAKYTPAGGDVWYALAAEPPHAVIRVRDTGAGMTPDMICRAFEPFVQADETLDRADGGIGVGLTLVKAIVELHGGDVKASSAGLGRGSEFVVRLPLSHAPLSSPPQPQPLVRPAPRRVLIVEDDPDIRTSLVAMLQLDGHEVVAVETGSEALRSVAHVVPDVALIDIGLPEMSGYEVARAIRALHPSAAPRLIALTGYGRPSDKLAAAAAGFDHHLTKPLDPCALNHLLRTDGKL